jgi:hypothetical protein
MVHGGYSGPRQRQVVDDSEKLSIGTVQRFIKNGMFSDEVIFALGAPNMVTRNAAGNETWIYDKVHSEYETDHSEDGFRLILFGAQSSRTRSKSKERTLTIIIRFDADSRVSDFSYRSTSF